MNDKKDPPKKTLPGSKRRPPASLFLWLLAFLVLASLIVFNSSPYFTTPEEWTANTFLSHLEKGEIVSAEIMPESDKILAISGEFRNAPKAPAETKKADGGKAQTADGAQDKESLVKSVENAVKQLLSDKDDAAENEEKKPAPAIVEKDLTMTDSSTQCWLIRLVIIVL